MGDDAVNIDDPLQVYLGELKRILPLGRAEESDCFEHVRAGDEMAESARQRLVEANLLLVVSIAEHYRNRPVHLLVLIEKGNEGLLRAVDTLRDTGHDQFVLHATNHIERAIAEVIASNEAAAD